MSDVDAILRWIAAYGLAGSHLSAPDGPLDDDVWSALLGQVRTARLTGFLLSALADDALPATDRQIDAAYEAHLEASCGVLVVESRGLEVIDRLAEEGIDLRILKGGATAHLDYADPGQRHFGDVDLLVRSDQLDHAVGALRDAGLTRFYPEIRQGFDRRFGKGVSLVAPDALEVDLHRTFLMGSIGLSVDLVDLWASSETFTVGGRKAEALTREHRLLHACYTAAAGDPFPKVATLRDIAQLALHPDLDVATVIDSAQRWRGEGVVAVGVRAAWDTLGIGDVTALSAWARRIPLSPTLDRSLRRYRNATGQYAALSAEAISSIPRWRDRAALLHALAFPCAEFRASGTGSSLPRRALRGAGVMMRGGRS